MDHSTDALSAAGSSSAVGGASPFPQPMFLGFDDIVNSYFVIMPLNTIKPYNHEPVTRMIHRVFLTELGDFDRQAYPPVLESWGNPFSVCVKVTCSKKTFDSIRKKIIDIYQIFGGSSEMMKCYLASEAM